jgi:BolA protein
MSTTETKNIIESIMRESFAPLELVIIDDSAAHKGHLAALEHPQAGHFKLIMKSKSFDGLNAVKRHRMVYEKLKSLMDERIHAISLDLKASDE